MWQGKRISVVMPALNEEASVGEVIAGFLQTEVIDEIIVVDNGSSDRTREVAQQAGARVVMESERGYGAAVQRAFREGQHEYIVLCESDATFLPKDIFKLLAYAEDFALVQGSRTVATLIHERANMGWFLKWGDWCVAKCVEFLFLGPSLSDVGCTMLLITREALKTIQPYLTVKWPHLLPEITVVALLNGVKVVQLPVNYRERKGESKITGVPLGAIDVGLRMIGLIVRYRVRTWLRPLHT